MIKNSKLQNLFKLSSKITIIVPATVNINEEIDNTKHVDEVAGLLSQCKCILYNILASGQAVEFNFDLPFHRS